MSAIEQRKYILDEQIGYMITSIEIKKFPSSEVATLHSYILHRISQIPVRCQYQGGFLELREHNATQQTQVITSASLMSDDTTVLYKNIMIMHLQPGESVHLEMQVTTGNGLEHPCFRLVEHVWIDVNNKLHIEPLKSYTVEDIHES